LFHISKLFVLPVQQKCKIKIPSVLLGNFALPDNTKKIQKFEVTMLVVSLGEFDPSLGEKGDTSGVTRIPCAKKHSCAPVNKNYRVWSEK